MAERDFLLPDLGEGLTEGEIVSWLVAVGDAVEVDQPVAEIETAKAVVEVPSPFDGTVTALHAEVGEEVAVGEPLITVAVDGAAPADDHAPAAAAQPAAAQAETARGGDQDDGASGSVLVGYGTGSRRARRRRGQGAAGPAGAAPVAGAAAERARPLAKPPVRKLAKDLGVDLADVPGSGPEGIVTRADVEAYAGDGRREAAPPQAPAREAPPIAVPEAPAPDLVERRPLKGVRKAIAAHMTRSRQEIPEAVAWVDVDATRLVGLRDELAAFHDDVKITPLALILRACVAALKRHPEVNARLDADAGEIVVQRFVNLGVAVQTAAGLMVPVITGAERLSTVEIAAELGRLAAAARDRTIRPEELRGSTFSVSNYGAFGVDGGDMVINYPEAAILGVGRIADRPWVVDGELAVRKVVQLSLAFDHRVCDGAEAGGFLRHVADLVESPARLVGAL